MKCSFCGTDLNAARMMLGKDRIDKFPVTAGMVITVHIDKPAICNDCVKRFHEIFSGREVTDVRLKLIDGTTLHFRNDRWYLENAVGAETEIFRSHAMSLLSIHNLKGDVSQKAWEDVIKEDQSPAII